MKNKSTRREFLELNAALLTSTTFAASGVSLVHAASRRDKYRVFSKGRIASLTLKNRIVRSATAEGASPKGQMNKDGLTMYEHLAAGGVGMIITGHMVAVRGGDAHENQTHIDDDRYISTLREIADVVHHNGADCKLIAQLSHAGPNGMVDPIAASEMPGRPNGKKPRTLSITEISDLIAQYSAAVRRAKTAGFDGVELHAAHGYLLSAFLSPATNTRGDEFGGSPARRAEIIRRIISAARKTVGPDYPILIKMNCDDQGENESAIPAFIEMVQELEKAGANAIDISGRNPIRSPIDSPEKQSYFLPYGERAGVKVPVILTGGNRSIEELEKIIQKNKIQFFGFARPLVREPDLPRRWQEGRGGDTATCISCNDCLKSMIKGTRCVRV